jgi:hypothetical protein
VNAERVRREVEDLLSARGARISAVSLTAVRNV